MNFLSQEICGGPLQKGCRIFLFPGGKCKNSSYNFVKSIQKICICAIITPNLSLIHICQSIAGFLPILGAVVTGPGNAAAAFAGTGAGDTIVAGVTMGVTAFTDPVSYTHLRPL